MRGSRKRSLPITPCSTVRRAGRLRWSFAPVALPVAIVGAVIVYFTAPLMLRGQGETEAATRDWRVEIPVSGKALAIGRVAADFGIDQTQQYALDVIRRWDADLAPSAGR